MTPAGSTPESAEPAGPRIVALGGGHGLSASLSALRTLTDRLTAVVTVADDGGSSGRLRAAYGILPPGDLRMALAALAGDTGHAAVLRDLVQYRFPPDARTHGGSPGYPGLAGHPVGNLLLAGLFEQTGDPVAALETLGRMLELPATTRVLPMSTVALDIAAEVVGVDRTGELTTVRGQVEVATTRGRVLAVHLLPPDAPACPQAVAAVGDADALVLGPGSLFTSLLPHLLLPDLRKAVTAAHGRRILVLNLVAQPGETDGFSPASHLEVLAALVPELSLDCVIADVSAVAGRDVLSPLRAAAEELGATVHVAPLAHADSPGVHDPAALTRAFATVLGTNGQT